MLQAASLDYLQAWGSGREGGTMKSTKAGESKTKLKMNHWRSSPGLELLSSRVSTSTAFKLIDISTMYHTQYIT